MELEMLAHTNDGKAVGKYLSFFPSSSSASPSVWMAIVKRTRQQKGAAPVCFLKLNNNGAKQRSRASPCGTGDKIPAAAAAATQAVIQKGENEREEGSMQKVIRHIWPTFIPTQCKELLLTNTYVIFINIFIVSFLKSQPYCFKLQRKFPCKIQNF